VVVIWNIYPQNLSKRRKRMPNEEVQVIEVNGIKMEVDLRHARKICNFKIGDSVRVLVKEYSEFKSYSGVIVGFDSFKNRPTIVVSYLDMAAYSTSPIKFAYINSESADVEICPLVDNYISVEKSDVVSRFDSLIFKAKNELEELLEKKNYFLNNFNKYFAEELEK
jgi:hypothetical protein